MIKNELQVGDLVEARGGSYAVLFTKHIEDKTITERTYLDGKELGIVLEIYKRDTCALVYLFGRKIEVWGEKSPWRKIT
jgi:putative heme degradation protein